MKKNLNKLSLTLPMMFMLGLASFSLAFAQERSTGKKTICPEVPRITGFQAFAFYKQGKAIVADAHARSAYQRQHIFGAINIPWNEVENVHLNIPKHMMIVLYCR